MKLNIPQKKKGSTFGCAMFMIINTIPAHALPQKKLNGVSGIASLPFPKTLNSEMARCSL